MDQLISYLFGRMGKRTCPIIKIEKAFDISYNSPWNEYYVIEFKDGTTVELMEKPKFEHPNQNPNP